jgi:hypothetical protein
MTDKVDQDSPWKELVDQDLPVLLAFFFADIHADLDWSRDIESLEQELRQIVPQAEMGKRIADKLLKAFRRHGGDERYFHLEAQGKREDDFARRVHQYNYRFEERFQQHVVSLVILLDDDPDWRPDRYVASQYGCERTLIFRTQKVLDWQGKENELEFADNPVGLFVLAQLESKRTRDDAEERARVKLRLILRLHERKMEADQLRHWYRYLDWLLPLPKELEKQVWTTVRRQEEEHKMPFITFAERHGMEKGLEQGLEKGLEQGMEKGLEKGLEQGLEQGLEKGLAKGERLGLLKALGSLLKKHHGDEGLALLAEMEKLEKLDTLRTLLLALIETESTLEDLRKLMTETPNLPV